MIKHASTLIEGALLGTIKKADLDPMLVWGLLGGAAGLGSSLYRTAAGDTPAQGAGSRALMAGLTGAGLGAATAGGLQALGVNPKLPKLITDKKDRPAPISSSLGVGALGAGALAGAGALDRARARNRTLSANVDEFIADPSSLDRHKDIKPHVGAMPAAPGNKPLTLLSRLRGLNQPGQNYEARLQQMVKSHTQLGNAAKALQAEKLLQALRTKGQVARPGRLGKMPARLIAAGGGAAALAHYLLNRKD